MASSFTFPKNFNTEAGNSAGYFKFEQGPNKFRIMSEPIFGQEYWKTEVDEQGNAVIGDGGKAKRKPFRVALDKVVPASELEMDQWGKPGKATQFMAMTVYDWNAGIFKILSVTQKQVTAGIKALVESDDWGNPQEYDITVTKNGSGRETKYSVMPGAKKKMPENIVEEYAKRTINLQALFDGTNPFEAESKDLPF